MFIDPATLSILITTLIAAVIVLVIFAWQLAYFREKERDLAGRIQRSEKRSEELLEHAHHRVRSILEKTAEKADKMLLETEYLNQHLTAEVDNSLKKIVESHQQLLSQNSADFFTTYHKELEEVKQVYMPEITRMLSDIQKTTERELKDFMSIIVKETVEGQSIIGKKLDTEFEKTQKQIQAYKDTQIQKIDTAISKMVVRVAEDVVGKTIAVSDHQALVLEALEKAKQEGMFAL